MNWFYSSDGNKNGPHDITEISKLVSTGEITDSTLVWTNGMADWKPFIELRKFPHLFSGSPMAICAETGQLKPKEEMARFGDLYVSAEYKNAYLQKMQEGVASPTLNIQEYAGFWIRFLAKFIDNMLLGVVNMVVQFVITLAMGGIIAASNPSEEAQAMLGILIMLVSFTFSIGMGMFYNAYFLPRYGATPGKMALGLLVINPDGTYVSKGKAIGRYFGEMLSAFTFTIGYIMAAFDDEKRSLHDRICETRVVKK